MRLDNSTNRTVIASLCAATLVPALFTASPAQAAKPARPAKITSVTATPGPKVGQVTLRWHEDEKNTTGYVLKTALSTFSKAHPLEATGGRDAMVTSIPAGRSSFVLSAEVVSRLGAQASSGNALFYRFSAVNEAHGSTSVRTFSHRQMVLPAPAAAKKKGTKIRIASFNVRSARKTFDKRQWVERAPDVAAEILSRKPGLVALQELGPGRADGKNGSTAGRERQTTSLESALAEQGGSRYQLVRTTPYVRPGRSSATQGARILYDTRRYTLLSSCPEQTGSRAYSSSCSIRLPKLRTDSEKHRIRAAVAEFRSRATGKKFWFVSAHLDSRHSSSKAKEKKLATLRKRQAGTIAARVAELDTKGVPSIVGGDFNSWQNAKGGNGAHDLFVAKGYYDTSAATHRVNFDYTTFNGFHTTLKPSSIGLGVRLDQVLVKGSSGSRRFENVMEVKDSTRSSDHNMVVADFVL